MWAVIGGQDVDRLPSASTCYNTLKVRFRISFLCRQLRGFQLECNPRDRENVYLLNKEQNNFFFF